MSPGPDNRLRRGVRLRPVERREEQLEDALLLHRAHLSYKAIDRTLYVFVLVARPGVAMKGLSP